MQLSLTCLVALLGALSYLDVTAAGLPPLPAEFALITGFGTKDCGYVTSPRHLWLEEGKCFSINFTPDVPAPSAVWIGSSSIFGSVTLYGDANCKEVVKVIGKDQMRKNKAAAPSLGYCQKVVGGPMVYSAMYTHA